MGDPQTSNESVLFKESVPRGSVLGLVVIVFKIKVIYKICAERKHKK